MNQLNLVGQTSLILAAAYGHESCVIELIKAGADVSIMDKHNAIALQYAAHGGKDEYLKELLILSDINHTDDCDLTALLLACERGSPKCVDLLLKAGADVNIVSVRHTTALVEAATWDHLECVQLLIDARAGVNFRTSTYSVELALNKAASYANHKCVEKLLSAGANVNRQALGLRSVLVDALSNSIALCKKAFEEAKMDYIPENHSHVTCVNLLIEAGVNVNMKEEEGRTALIQAAINDHHECVDLLIQRGADITQPDYYGRTPITSAAFFGSIKSLDKLLSAGADVNASAVQGYTALIASMSNALICWDQVAQDEERSHSPRNCKQKRCLQMLMEAGANVNAQTDDGISALTEASANGHRECIDLLLEAGADVNEVTISGWTPLRSSAYYGSTKCLEKLLSAGADVNILGHDQCTALMDSVWVSQNKWDQLSEDNNTPRNCKQKECVEMLIQAGANVNAQTDDGISALMKAAANGYKECLNLLLEAGADVNITCKAGCTSLMCSAMLEHEDCLDSLITGFFKCDKEKIGSTALTMASTNGHDECVKSLVRAGGDVNTKDIEGQNALIRASCFANFKCIEHLLNAGADVNGKTTMDNVTALMAASGFYNERLCPQMLEHTGNTCLSEDHSASKSIETLIKAGANVNAQTDSGISALMKASASGYKECVSLLLEAGADVNANCEEGCTSLIYSAMFGHEVCLDHLLAAGADVNIKENSGSAALLMASTYGHDKCVKSLVGAGAGVNVKDNEGFTALIRASSFANFKCIEHLLNAGADVNGTTTTGNVTALMAASGIYQRYYCQRMIEYTGITYLSEDHSASRSIETLINAGADVNIKDDADNIPLIKSISRRHEKCIPLLLAAGADVNARDNSNGSSALMIAIMEGKNETFDQLMKAGADVNIVNNNGSSAFLTAAVMGNVRAVKRLLKANCRINDTTRVAYKSLKSKFCSVRSDHSYIVRLLYAAGELIILSHMAAEHGDWILRYIPDLTARKMQLVDICRDPIRKYLLRLDPQQNLFSRIAHLELPQELKEYLFYGESLEDDSDGDGDNTRGDLSKYLLLAFLKPHKPHKISLTKMKKLLFF